MTYSVNIILISFVCISASDIVKKMFTLRFSPRKEMFNVRREKIMDLVKKHKLDRKSPEAQSNMTT
jgi:hypothetical protein